MMPLEGASRASTGHTEGASWAYMGCMVSTASGKVNTNFDWNDSWNDP